MTRPVTVKLPGRKAITAGGFCAPCVAEELQAQTAALQARYQNNAGEFAADAAGALAYEVPFTALLCREGVPTGDGRMLDSDSLRWDAAALPLPLRWTPADTGGHDGAVVVGLIEKVTRTGDRIEATGIIDGSNEAGAAVLKRMVAAGGRYGVSVDLDDIDFEVRVRAEMLMPQGDEAEMLPLGADALPGAPEADEQGRVTVYSGADDDELMVFTDCRLRAATLVDIPAFADAYVVLGDTPPPSGETPEAPAVEAEEDDEDDEDEAPMPPALVAAGAPVRPPAAWFGNPKLAGPTPITVTEDGRIFGHIALWGTCHTGIPGACVTPPRSATGYGWFRTGVIHTAEGTEVAVGRITMDTGHAGPRLAAAPAAAHYDHTGSAVADTAAGEDEHGIWIAGALRPGLSAARVRALRSSPMSGDWRTVGGQLELVAVLAVNMPGFPVPRHPRALVASGRTQSLALPVETAAQAVRRPAVAAAVDPRTTKLAADALAAQMKGQVHADPAVVAAGLAAQMRK